MRVVGIDLSLTATGLASIETIADVAAVTTKVVKTKVDTGTLHSRHNRLETIASAVVQFSKAADLAVLESPSYSSGGRGTWDRAGLWWWVVSVLMLTGVPVAQVSPKSRAKFATNNGNAGKGATAVAIGRLWPDVQLQDDNDSDALVLATMGALHLGLTVPFKPWQHGEVAKIEWPAL